MPYEVKDRHVLRFDGDPICQQIKDNEDNYDEEAMGPNKPDTYLPLSKDHDRHFNKLKRAVEV